MKPTKFHAVLAGILFVPFGALELSAEPASNNSTNVINKDKVELLAAEGKVEISRLGNQTWVAAQTNLSLELGDRLRTGLRSRAVVRFSNLSVLRINELTTFVVQPPSAPGKLARLDLKSGSTYFFSRERPADVEFSTPLSSGAIRGTEFSLFVAENDGRSVVTLLDGALTLSNSLGAVDLATGEQATVEPGQLPKKTAVINAINIIQWCLYYPGVLDVNELGLTAGELQALSPSLGAYRSGDLLGALNKYPAGRAPQSDAGKIYFAALLLAVGQVEQSEAQLASLSAASPLAQALREVVAAVKHQTWTRSVPATSATEWLAESYYLQSRANLDDALKAARKSVIKSPDFGFGWARVAELEFSFGRVPAANDALEQGLKFSPRNAEAVSLKGFLLAAQNKFSAARRQFDEAIALDSGLGNAWLGRGLVRIHAGDAGGGRRDLQVAATLEPQRALLRSYLGKAFSNAGDNHHAEKEFGLAEKLDPNDPTAWLYAALLYEQENKINEAVNDLEKSQQLNDNRSVFRSRLLLDQDLAVRSANLAKIYQDDGLAAVSMCEAVKAVSADYANYSAHLFLANSYFGLLDPSGVNLRYETPFQNEYLVANLLAPVGAGALSQKISQQEYSKLFETDGVGVSSDTKYTSHGDWYQSAVEYGTFGNTSFAFEQDYSSFELYRPNSSEEDTLYDFKLKQQLTLKDDAFAELEWRNTTSGNLIQYYNQAAAAAAPISSKEEQQPILVAGLHHEWSPGMDTIFLFSWLNDSLTVTNPFGPVYLIAKNSPGGPIQQILPSQAQSFAMHQFFQSQLEIYSVEAQHIWQTPRFTTIIGARWQTGEFDTQNFQQNYNVSFINLFQAPVTQNVSADFNRENGYAYEQWQALDSLQIIGGISYERLVIPENFRYAPVTANSETSYHLSPKGGIIWTPLQDTTLRAGYSQSVGGASIDQSFQLEPSQVAGFNQAFRSLIPEAVAGANAGATFTVYGVSFEQKLDTRTYLTVEGDLLKSAVSRQDGAYEFNNLGGPFVSGLAENLDFTEGSVTATAHQLLGRDWVIGADYRYSEVWLSDNFPGISPGVAAANQFIANYNLRGTLQTLDLQVIWQHPSGLFARSDAVWTHQDNSGYSPALPGDDFWQINLQAGWRFFRRHAEITVGLLNLTGQDYHLNPLNLYSEAPRDRVFFTQLKFQF